MNEQTEAKLHDIIQQPAYCDVEEDFEDEYYDWITMKSSIITLLKDESKDKSCYSKRDGIY